MGEAAEKRRRRNRPPPTPPPPLSHSHVYCRDAVDELNVKPKNWTDLVDGTPFKRSDLITLQDPAAPRDASSFDHVKRGVTPAPVGRGSSSSVDASRVSADARRALGRLGAAAPGRGAGARDPRLQGPVRATVPTPTFKPGATTWATDDPSQRPASERKAAEKRVAAEREAVEAAAAAAPPTKRAPRPYDDPARHRPDAMRTAGAASKSFTSTAVAPAARGAADRASTRIYVNPTTKGYARLHTSVGDINFELHADLAPRACENFLTLAAAGYYDATPFHRVIKHFMAQGGDPTGTGAGGESIYGEPFADEVTPKLAHAARGVLSMANAGPGTNKSQFFVLFKSAPHLDGKHTVFGRAVGGLETLAALEAVAVDADDRPKQPVTITGVTVYVDPFAEEAKKAAEREGAAAAAAADGGARGAWFSEPGAAAAPAPSRTGVGKYLPPTAAGGEGGGGGGEGAPRAAKKAKAAAASAFDAW